MAWITKNSAGATVHDRGEPYLTEAMRQELQDKHIPRYETTLACTMPALHMIQHEYGWVPYQAMREIAEFLSIRPADVADCASFYEEYWLEPKGKQVIAVCRSIACEFCGHAALTERACQKLGIEVGETTEDGEYTIIELECLGSCGTAPVALIGEKLHENLTPEGLEKLIEDGRGRSEH
ncbi:MAG: NADH-quinone oxidoreductase subunit NuoE [Phycisphaerales bacterium]|nr:MAG: NADH-quinone oxidoreductase subunit NuoE [Phycisphaerales bacterium]